MNAVMLNPPETLVLTPPEPVKPVAAEQASGMVKLDEIAPARSVQEEESVAGD